MGMPVVVFSFFFFVFFFFSVYMIEAFAPWRGSRRAAPTLPTFAEWSRGLRPVDGVGGARAC